MKYVQAENDPCAFRHLDTGHKAIIRVDDILTRGSREHTTDFFSKLADRFDCKEPEYLLDGDKFTFTGWDLSLRVVDGE